MLTQKHKGVSNLQTLRHFVAKTIGQNWNQFKPAAKRVKRYIHYVVGLFRYSVHDLPICAAHTHHLYLTNYFYQNDKKLRPSNSSSKQYKKSVAKKIRNFFLVADVVAILQHALQLIGFCRILVDNRHTYNQSLLGKKIVSLIIYFLSYFSKLKKK